MLQSTNRRDAIYRVSNRCAFSGFWIKLESRRDKSRLYRSHFLELAVGISNILFLAEASYQSGKFLTKWKKPFVPDWLRRKHI